MQYEYIEIKNKAGMTIRGIKNFPELIKDKEKLPVIIIVHGHTGNKLGNNFFFVKMSKYFTSRGYATFRFDFTGSGESDGEFEDMTLTSELEDMDCIIEYIKRDNGINQNELFIIGHSMGGLITTIKAQEYNPKKIILLAPANDMYESVLYMYNKYGKGLDEIKHIGLKIKKDFMKDMERYKLYGKARLYNGEVLIYRGSKDESVSGKTCERTRDAFKGKVKYRELENIDHSFKDYDTRLEMIAEIGSFINE